MYTIVKARIVDAMFLNVKNDSFIKYQKSVGITRKDKEKI
tara:strand:+ start:473 stop:592 length:120 start_codon:yes stop_codon:yes gene_type:complete